MSRTAVFAGLAMLGVVFSGCQAHELAGCSFPANISSRANLTVAGAALEALDGSNLIASDGTVLLPTDASFQTLLENLNVSTADLLGDLVNTTVAILAYHYIPHGFYTTEQLVGNRTLQTGLGDLESESRNRTVYRNLTFTEAGGEVRVRARNNTATLLDEGERICNRQVYTIDAVLIPFSNLASAPQNLTQVIATRTAAKEAKAEAEAAKSPVPAPSPAADQGAFFTASHSALLLGSVGACLLMGAL